MNSELKNSSDKKPDQRTRLYFDSGLFIIVYISNPNSTPR